MKKAIAMLLSVIGFIMFTFSATAFSITTYGGYVINDYDSFTKGEYYGSHVYWENRVVNGEITADDIPKAMMGDANIDGKVNAVDALFALNFAVHGNIQNYEFTSGVKTPETVVWNSELREQWDNGTIEEYTKDKTNLLTYCKWNSPFFANVNKDNTITAADALLILQYAVDPSIDFPINDFTGIKGWFCYYPWPTEYYPGYQFNKGPVTPTPTDVV